MRSHQGFSRESGTLGVAGGFLVLWGRLVDCRPGVRSRLGVRRLPGFLLVYSCRARSVVDQPVSGDLRRPQWPASRRRAHELRVNGKPAATACDLVAALRLILVETPWNPSVSLRPPTASRTRSRQRRRRSRPVSPPWLLQASHPLPCGSAQSPHPNQPCQ